MTLGMALSDNSNTRLKYTELNYTELKFPELDLACTALSDSLHQCIVLAVHCSRRHSQAIVDPWPLLTMIITPMMDL